MQILEKKMLLVDSAVAHMQGGGVVLSKRHGFKIVLRDGFYYLTPVPPVHFQPHRLDEGKVREFLHMVRKQAPVASLLN